MTNADLEYLPLNRKSMVQLPFSVITPNKEWMPDNRPRDHSYQPKFRYQPNQTKTQTLQTSFYYLFVTPTRSIKEETWTWIDY